MCKVYQTRDSVYFVIVTNNRHSILWVVHSVPITCSLLPTIPPPPSLPSPSLPPPPPSHLHSFPLPCPPFLLPFLNKKKQKQGVREETFWDWPFKRCLAATRYIKLSAANTIYSVLPVCSLHVHVKHAITHANKWFLTLAFHIIFIQAPANFTWNTGLFFMYRSLEYVMFVM